MNPLVSIIIVNHNGKDMLWKCLDSLFAVTDMESCEVIIVDNNSNDGSKEMIQDCFPEIIFLQLQENLGFALPSNTGARQANGLFYVFLNNDTILTKNWLSELLKTITFDDKIAAVQSFLIKPDGAVDSSGDFVDELGRPYSSKQQNPEDHRLILSARAACMIVKRDVFWEMGGFDDNFFASFEDVHFGWNAWLCGYQVVLAPRSVVYHIGGQTVGKIRSRMKFHGVKNQAYIVLLNLEAGRIARSALGLFSFYFLKRLSAKSQSSSTESPSVKDLVGAIFWIFSNFGMILKKRRELSARRKFSTDKLQKMGLITKRMNEK